jgi:L-alanine-DL-glutamate epimerase-like enolase superfamily enzyme
MKLAWQIVQFQLKETFAIAYGNYSFREALIVTLESHGCKGYGECTAIDYYHIDLASFTAQLDQCKIVIESQSIKQPKDFYIFLESLQLPSFLRSALDCAYWDLFGKLEQCSFLALNAIDCKNLPQSSITISVDEVAQQIKKIEQSAWNHFKVKCNHLDKEAVAQLIALNKPVALDSNGSFTQDDCLWLETYAGIENFTYLEQPMKPGAEQYSALNADGKANWMADEDCQNAAKLKDLVPHYNSINIKLVKCGGLTPALQMIAEARALGFQLMIGCMTESSIGISAGAVLAPLCDYADLDGANLIANDIAIGSTIVDGVIQLSDGYGLGIKIN